MGRRFINLPLPQEILFWRIAAIATPKPSAKRFDKYETQHLEKVLVANVDQLLIVMSVRQPALRAAVVDRFLIVAERGELRPLLAINKIDLAKPPKATLAGFDDLGLKTILCSALTGAGLEELRDRKSVV